MLYNGLQMPPRDGWGRWIAGALAAGALLCACAPAPAEPEDGRARVVATIGMIADAAQRIGGERVRVVGLMGPGVDPHLYKASEGDVRRIFRAEVILYNGLHLESRMGEVLEHMEGTVRVAAVAEAVPETELLAPAELEGAYDPHLWFDVRLWMRAVERVRDVLVEHDPAHATEYRTNATAYLAELAELDDYVRRRAQLVPPAQRVVVTAHDAFGYFGRAYGFEVLGLQGMSTATEAGTGDVQALAELIARRRIRAIFVESSIPPRTVEAVRAAVRARGFEVEIGGELYSDALGDPGSPAGTYAGMVRHNIDTIVAALASPSAGGDS